MRAILLILSFASVAQASVPAPVPASGLRRFVGVGLFEGGDPRPAVLGAIDVISLPREAVERWTLTFAGEGAPRFRLRYEKADTYPDGNGSYAERQPPRFVVVFRSLRRSTVTKASLREAVKRSRFVEDAIIYPPLEDGDTALELKLKGPVLFEPYQPAGRDGRLILDLVAR